jgi:heme oxygenase
MAAKCPDERRATARLAAHSLWATTTDRAARTEAARAAQWRKFLDQVDPQRQLPEDERNKRALSARKAYYARLTLKSVQARKARRYGPEVDVR